MASEMIERVAKILWEEAGGVAAMPTAVKDWHGAARKIIEAIRMPTKAMEQAADDLDDWGVASDPGPGNASALAHWTAMIDEALKD